MRLFATTARTLSAFLLLAGIATAQSSESQIISNGTIITEVFSNGNIGGDCSGGHTGFVYMGIGGGGTVLCAASFIVGVDNTLTIGQNYATLDEAIGWLPGIIVEPTEFPYPTLDQGVRATFSDNEGVGLDVVMSAYFSSNADLDDFIVLRYELTNTSGAELAGLVPGLFMDWDLDPFGTNEAVVVEEEDLMYVLDPIGTTSLLAGTVILEDDLSGWTCFVEYPTAGQHPPDQLWNALTIPGPETCDPQDVRGPIGSSPITLAPDETAVVAFALVAGEDEEALLAHTAAARGAFAVSAESTTQVSTLSLDSAFPNPVSGTATLGYSLHETQHVTLEVYDLLGRSVATLVDGVRQAGEQSVAFDASTLPSGVYVYRLTAGSTQLTERFTVMR